MCESDVYLTWKLLMKEVVIDTMGISEKICKACFKIYDSFSRKCTKLKAHLAIVAFRACKDSSTPTPAPFHHFP